MQARSATALYTARGLLSANLFRARPRQSQVRCSGRISSPDSTPVAVFPYNAATRYSGVLSARMLRTKASIRFPGERRQRVGSHGASASTLSANLMARQIWSSRGRASKDATAHALCFHEGKIGQPRNQFLMLFGVDLLCVLKYSLRVITHPRKMGLEAVPWETRRAEF